MTPVGAIFSRFARLVHDTGQALGKQIRFEISGEETELDKGVVERIADPLTHLVRNAGDRGSVAAAIGSRNTQPAASSSPRWRKTGSADRNRLAYPDPLDDAVPPTDRAWGARDQCRAFRAGWRVVQDIAAYASSIPIPNRVASSLG